MAANVEFCTSCGSPMDGSVKVEKKLDSDQKPKVEAPIKEEKTEQSGFWSNKKYIFGGIAAAFVGLIILLAWDKEIELKVNEKFWSKSIRIERLTPLALQDFCDVMPSRAYSVRRTTRTKQRQVQDGETCHTVRRDNGDGTFSNVQQCSPKYRMESYQAPYCFYKVDNWEINRTKESKGKYTEKPYWPKYELKGTSRYPERVASKYENWNLIVEKTGEQLDEETTCNVKKTMWKKLKPGSVYSARAGVVLGNIDCSSIGH